MAITTAQLIFAFGLLGNIISFGVFLAPMPTFYKIYKKKSTEGFQCLPYVVALLSAMMWIYYAFLKPNSTFLITINSFGCLIESLYIIFFLFYASKRARLDTLKQIGGLIVVGFGLIVTLTYFFTHGTNRGRIVGWVCLVFSLCVFVAPLAILREVIRTKSAEYMPLPLSAFLTLNAVAWFFYGLLLKDYNIAIPNVLGFFFGIMQIILYKIYSKSKKEKDLERTKLPELADQIIILDDHKLSPAGGGGHNIENSNERVIDIAKISGELERIPVVLRSVQMEPHHVMTPMEPRSAIVAAA